MKKTSLNHLRYHVILRPEPEGGFTVIVPALPGCITYGKTLKEAKEMGRDAIQAYIESLRKRHEPIPTDEESVIASVVIHPVRSGKTLSYA